MVTLTVMVYILLRVNITPPESYHVSWAAHRQRNRRRGENDKGRRCARGNRGKTLRGRRARRSRASQDDPLRIILWVDKPPRHGRRVETLYAVSSSTRLRKAKLSLHSHGRALRLRKSVSEARFSQSCPPRATKPTSRLSTQTCPKRPALSTLHLLALAFTLLFAPTTIPALSTNTDHSKITDGCGALRAARTRGRTTRAKHAPHATGELIETSARPK